MGTKSTEGIRRHGLGWQYRWTPPGSGRRETGPTLSLEDAKQFKRWVETNRRRRVKANDSDIEDGSWRFQPFSTMDGETTFGEHAKTYVREQERSVGPRSLKNIRNSIARVESIHDAPLHSLSDAELDDLLESLLGLKKQRTTKGVTVDLDEQRYAMSTIKTTMVTVRAVIRHAVRTRVLMADPSPNYEPNVNADRIREHRYLTPEQYLALRGCAEDERTRLMMDLMAYAGLRLGELLGLRVSRVFVTEDEPNPYVRVDWQIYTDGTGGLPKGTDKNSEKRKRNIRIHEALARDLRAYIEARGNVKSDWLFPSPMDETRPTTHNWGSTKNSPWSRAVAKAEAVGALAGLRSGLPTPHDLRHSHASWLFAKNVPLIKVSKRLGHKNIIVTATVYAHLLELFDDESSNVMEEMFSAAIGDWPTDVAAGDERPRLSLVR